MLFDVCCFKNMNGMGGGSWVVDIDSNMNFVDSNKLILKWIKLEGNLSLLRFCFERCGIFYFLSLPGLGRDFILLGFFGGTCSINKKLLALDSGDNIILNIVFFSKARLNYLRSFLRLCAFGLVLSRGYFAELVTRGIGYRFRRVFNSNCVLLIVGRSHRTVFLVPKDILIVVKRYRLIMFSLDKGKLSYYSKLLKLFRYPDIYKGKGLKFGDEVLVLKEGKSKK